MAERRMFAKTIIDSDAFIDMPMSARLLYYDLSMRADDEGFVNAPKKIMRMIGATDDDMRILIAKKFVIDFDTGVIVIKHWKIHNYIRGDRLHQTKYVEEKSKLSIDEKGSYTLCQSNVSQLVDNLDTEVRLGKDSIGKVNRFIKPTLEEVKAYCDERQNNVDPQTFIDFYESKGWKVGKSPMKDWKACVRTWERNKQSSNRVEFKGIEEHMTIDVSKNVIDDELSKILKNKRGN